MNSYKIKSYLRYLKKARYWRGHGVHPPFAYEIIRNLFFADEQYYLFETIEEIRKELLKSKETVTVKDYGAGSLVDNKTERKLSVITKHHATTKKQGELMTRLTVFFKPQNIIELGTSLGIGTLYMALVNSKSKVYTIEGSENLAKQAQKNFDKVKARNVESRVGEFNNELPEVLNLLENVDMVYFDGHHDYDATIKYFNTCLPYANKSAVFIFDDIHWSEGMTKAWNKIVENNNVSISFELFDLGIAIINRKVEKQHYVVLNRIMS